LDLGTGADLYVKGGISKPERIMQFELAIADFRQPGPFLSRLPKHVRLVNGAWGDGPIGPNSNDLYEFEVVTGNASYMEGERFYLTPGQAKIAYFSKQPQLTA
jgi:hypothetical protein